MITPSPLHSFTMCRGVGGWLQSSQGGEMFLTNSQLPILLCVSSLKPCVYMRVDIISLTVCALRGGLLMHTWRGAGESPHTKNRPRPDHNAPFPHLTTLTSHNMHHAPPPPTSSSSSFLHRLGMPFYNHHPPHTHITTTTIITSCLKCW